MGDGTAQEFHNRGLHVFATARDLAKVRHLRVLGLGVLQHDLLSADSI